MLRLSKREDYSILILTYLSTRQGLGTSARQVAEHHHLSPTFAATLLKDMAKSSLLRSERGANGGYFLDMPPSELTVFKVLECISGDYAFASCVLTDEGCDVINHCSIQKPIKIMNDRICETLRSMTISDLQEMATQ